MFAYAYSHQGVKEPRAQALINAGEERSHCLRMRPILQCLEMVDDVPLHVVLSLVLSKDHLDA